MEYLLKILGFLCLFIFQSCFAEDLLKINQSIDSFHAQIQNHPNDALIVFQVKSKFEDFFPILQKCVADENKEIQYFSQEMKALNKINHLDIGLKEKENHIKLLDQHQNRKSFCEFMLLKINRLQNQLYLSEYKLYQAELFNKQNNILMAFSQFDEPIVTKSSIHFAITEYLKYSNITLNIRTLLFGLLLLIFLKILSLGKYSNNAFLKKISLIEYVKVILVFLVLAPVRYIVLKTAYSHHDEIILDFFHSAIVQGMVISFIIYFYFFYKSLSLKKDFLLILGHSFLYLFIARYCFELNYLLINDFSSQEILVKKYLVLILLQPIFYSVAYWSYIKILKIHSFFQYASWWFFMVANLIFIVGLLGYVNFAVNLDLILIFNSVAIVWMFFMYFLKNTLFSIIDVPSHPLHQLLVKIFQDRQKIAVFNIKLITFIIYYSSIFIMISTMIVTSSWFIPKEYLQNIDSFLFEEKHIGIFSFKINNIFQAIIIFCLLNLLNYGLSQYFAKKLFQEKVSQQKTNNLLNCLGYMLSILIVLKFIGFNLQNFMIIFGGLSLGLGLGLKDLISSLISSVILFINRPFKIGDYIEIGQTKGHVKKVSLLETTIETADSNTLILPNQYVASSVIQNFTYENKAFQKVHVNYTINNLNIDKEEDIKIKILEELRENPYLLESPHHVINIVFSLLEQATDVFRLEIIFFLREQIDIKEEMTKINRKIHERLKKMHLDVHYENMQYPYK